MVNVQRLIAKYEGLGRPKFILAGHGYWSPHDRFTIVPPRTRLLFYVRHGQALFNPPSFDIDRGEFNEEGIIIGRQGGYRLIHPARVYEAGEQVANYTLGERNRLLVPQPRQRIARGGIVTGMKHFDIRFGNNPVDSRFITGNMRLSDIFADLRFHGADLHWSACREQI